MTEHLNRSKHKATTHADPHELAGPEPTAAQQPSWGWPAERAALDLLGYSAPLPLAEPARAEAVRAGLTGAAGYVKNPHTTSQGVRALLSDPALIDHVNLLCGGGWRLWRSALFVKEKGAAEIGWHHDKHFHSATTTDIRLDEIGAHYSVLFGLTDITQSTGMIQVIPGSHIHQPAVPRDTRAFHMRPAQDHIMHTLPSAVLRATRSVPIPAGSFMIFHSALLHRSLAHVDGQPRLGLAIRLVREGIAIPIELAVPQDVIAFPPQA